MLFSLAHRVARFLHFTEKKRAKGAGSASKDKRKNPRANRPRIGGVCITYSLLYLFSSDSRNPLFVFERWLVNRIGSFGANLVGCFSGAVLGLLVFVPLRLLIEKWLFR